MKPYIQLFILIISISLFACQTQKQKIELNDGLHITLPGDFIIDEDYSTSFSILKAQYSNQQIICWYAPLSGLDTIASEMVTSILRLNTEKYIEPFDGVEISINSIMIANAKAFDFRFNYARKHTSYQVYGKSLIYNDHMFFLTYEAPYPLESSIQKRIDSFFKSLQLD